MLNRARSDKHVFNSTLVCYLMGVVISFWVENQFKTNKNRNCYFSLTKLFCLLTNLGKLTRNLLLVLNKAFYFGNCSALTFKNLYSIFCSFLCFFLACHIAKRFVRLLHKLYENTKGKPFFNSSRCRLSIDRRHLCSQSDCAFT